jgi:copper homeostasis protein
MTDKKECLLETIVLSLDDAIAAERAGADRFELCSALSLGGLTPTPGLLQSVKDACRLPVMCMIRPRQGGMFYSDADFKVMMRDAEIALENSADGLVFGVLTHDSEIEVPRCRDILSLVDQARRGRQVETVFHRAFDITARPDTALEQLIDLGFDRILTSGRAETALGGVEEIKRTIELARERIEVLPGGDIDETNVREIIRRTGPGQIHAYLPTVQTDPTVLKNPAIRFGEEDDELRFSVVDPTRVRAVKRLISQ